MFSEILIVLDRSGLMMLKGEEPARSRALSRGLSFSSSRAARARSNSKEQDAAREGDSGDTATQFLMGAHQKARRTIEARSPASDSGSVELSGHQLAHSSAQQQTSIPSPTDAHDLSVAQETVLAIENEVGADKIVVAPEALAIQVDSV